MSFQNSLQVVHPDDALELAKACMNQITPDTYSAAMRCIVTFEGRDNLPRITLPTLVLAGDQDQNAPAPMMEKMASKIPGAEYVLLAETGHLAPIENAEGFNSSCCSNLFNGTSKTWSYRYGDSSGRLPTLMRQCLKRMPGD